MIAPELDVKPILEAVSAVGTFLAAVFAAVSAWTSKRSADAARASVDEARAARKAQLLPRLTLEKDFLDLEFSWPHPKTLNGEAVFLARRHWKDSDPTPPSFTLRNFGESPALEVTIEFELEDNGGDFTLPDHATNAGLRLETCLPSKAGEVSLPLLYYMNSNGKGAGIPLYRKYTVDLPSCSPGQERKIELPQSLCNRLFLRGLQFGAGRSQDDHYKDLILAARITCYTTEQERHETLFKWKVSPFSYGATSPVKVYGHVDECPIGPKPDRPRVAV